MKGEGPIQKSHFLDGLVRVEVDTALFPKGGPPAAALRVSRGDEAPVPEVPCPAADSLLALVALVGFMKLSDELGRMEEEGAVPRLPLSGLAGGPPPLATDDIVIPVMLDVALFFTLPSLTLKLEYFVEK